MNDFKTADLCDDFDVELSILAPGFSNYGLRPRFCGKVSTIKCVDDNSLVRDAVSSEGESRVLVIDNAASMRCAVLGDQLAELAVKNNWSGIIVNGCIRDSFDISATNFLIPKIPLCLSFKSTSKKLILSIFSKS